MKHATGYRWFLRADGAAVLGVRLLGGAEEEIVFPVQTARQMARQLREMVNAPGAARFPATEWQPTPYQTPPGPSGAVQIGGALENGLLAIGLRMPGGLIVDCLLPRADVAAVIDKLRLALAFFDAPQEPDA